MLIARRPRRIYELHYRALGLHHKYSSAKGFSGVAAKGSVDDLGQLVLGEGKPFWGARLVEGPSHDRRVGGGVIFFEPQTPVCRLLTLNSPRKSTSDNLDYSRFLRRRVFIIVK